MLIYVSISNNNTPAIWRVYDGLYPCVFNLGWFAIALLTFLLTHVGNNNSNVIFWIWFIQ